MVPFVLKFITASDGTRLRTGVFEPEKQSRRVCVLLGGRTEFIEKYYEVIGELNGRGYIVTTFDWRGQGGSARSLSDAMKGDVGTFDEYGIDLASFMEQVAAPLSPATPLLLAHSMGGHMALRALHDRPGQFCAAVLSSPMIAVSGSATTSFAVRAIAGLYSALGKRGAYAWGAAGQDPHGVDFAHQICTGDEGRYARTQDILKAYPSIRLGGPTWGWAKAAYTSMNEQARTGYAEAIQTPILVVGAGKDRVVNLKATRAFAARLPAGKYVALEDSEHEILMERDAIRARFWNEFDAFVETV